LKGLEIRTLHLKPSESSGKEELINLPNRPEDDPLFLYLHAEMSERLATAIGDLPDRERLVVTLYYYEEATMAEIGGILGILEPRVSQIHASAVLHLRAKLAASSFGKRARVGPIRPDRLPGNQRRGKSARGIQRSVMPTTICGNVSAQVSPKPVNREHC
jgi:hypothetical protein